MNLNNINGTNMTYKQIVAVFAEIAANHAQINEFFEGELYDFNATTIENYPLMWVQINPSKITLNTINYTINLTIADLVNSDIDNQQQVHSDIPSIFWDVLFLLRDKYDLEVQWDVNLTPFTEYKDDRVSGYNADIVLKIPRTFGWCDTPFRMCGATGNTDYFGPYNICGDGNCITNLFLENSASIDFVGTGTICAPLFANVNISTLSGNTLVVNPDGLYASGGTGIPSIPFQQVAFGSAANTLTSSPNLLWDNVNNIFYIQDTSFSQSGVTFAGDQLNDWTGQISPDGFFIYGTGDLPYTIAANNTAFYYGGNNSILSINENEFSVYVNGSGINFSPSLFDIYGAEVQINNLASTGTTMVVANSFGLLSTMPLPISVLPGGSNTQVQFNDNGAFGGNANFTFNKTTEQLNLFGSTFSAAAVQIADNNSNLIALNSGGITIETDQSTVTISDSEVSFATDFGVFALTSSGFALAGNEVTISNTVDTEAMLVITNSVYSITNPQVLFNNGGGESFRILSNPFKLTTFVGNAAGIVNTGANNQGFGYLALTSNTTGSSNDAYGFRALRMNTTGSENTAVGHDSNASNTTGGKNVTMGFDSMWQNTNGNNNIVIGVSALNSLTSGSTNTVIGYQSGFNLTNGSNNTIIGANVSTLPAATSNAVVLADGTGAFRFYSPSTGNVLFGTTTDTGQLLQVSGTTFFNGAVQIKDGTQANKYIFTSDANGNGSWEPSIFGSLTTTGTTGVSTLNNGILNIPVYQGQLTLTTTGSTGVATLIGNILNIPDYISGGTFVSSVSNNDGTLTISPTSGAVIASLNLANANTWTAAQTHQDNGLGATTANFISLVNNTAATSGVTQVSPALLMTGQGWKTTSPAGSSAVSFQQYVQPVNGTTAPTGNWILSQSISGATEVAVLTVNSAGTMILTSAGTPSLTFSAAGETFLVEAVAGTGMRYGNTNSGGGFLHQFYGGGTIGSNVVLQVGPTNSFFSSTLAVGATAVNNNTFLGTGAGTTALSSFNIPTGVAPTAPKEGDMWKTGTHLFIFLNGATVQIV